MYCSFLFDFPVLLLSQVKRFDKRTVFRQIVLFEIVEKSSALTDHFKKASAGMVIFCVVFEVGSEVVDALCEECDLYFRGSCIAFVTRVLGDDFVFLSHCVLLVILLNRYRDAPR
jgi:hypothetical protein